MIGKKYPYVLKWSWLYPFAWLHRLLFGGVKAVRNGALTVHIVTDENNLSDVSRKRVSLFRDLGMM